MKNIKDFTLEELKEELKKLGEKSFRAEQIFKWLYVEKVKSFDEMTNLSIALRETLKANYSICNFNIIKKQESSDGTKKYLFDVLDENAIETVLMQYHHGQTICVSSQIGCKMGCKFCASTGIAFMRSLTSGEIVEQITIIKVVTTLHKKEMWIFTSQLYDSFYKLFMINIFKFISYNITFMIINIFFIILIITTIRFNKISTCFFNN